MPHPPRPLPHLVRISRLDHYCHLLFLPVFLFLLITTCQRRVKIIQKLSPTAAKLTPNGQTQFFQVTALSQSGHTCSFMLLSALTCIFVLDCSHHPPDKVVWGVGFHSHPVGVRQRDAVAGVHQHRPDQGSVTNSTLFC